MSLRVRCPQGHVFVTGRKQTMCGKDASHETWYQCPFCKMKYTKDQLVLVEMVSGRIHPGWKSVEVLKRVV